MCKIWDHKRFTYMLAEGKVAISRSIIQSVTQSLLNQI
jgi:hypothetical protein